MADPFIAARWQFAFTIMFHYLFPPLTIGLGALLGTTALPKANLDKLFAISSASVTMQSEFDLVPAPRAGICFKPIESSQYDEAKAEIEELLKFSSRETGSSFKVVTDEYRFTWVMSSNPRYCSSRLVCCYSRTIASRGYDHGRFYC